MINKKDTPFGKNSAFARWALDFVEREDIALLPLNQEKAPITRSITDASRRNDLLRNWFNDDAMFSGAAAIVCGQKNGLIIIDCDVPKDRAGNPVPGPTGQKQFENLCAANGDRPSPVCQTTPSGGMHYFYKWREGVRNKVKIWHNGKRTLIDCRSDNGYAVVAQSGMDINQFHASKIDQRMPFPNRYKRLADESGRIPLLSEAPELPDWIYAFLTNTKEKDPEAMISSGMMMIGKQDQGVRNDTLNRVCFFLAKYFYDDPERLAEIREKAIETGHACGLEDDEIGPTVDSGMTAGANEGRATGDRGNPWYAEACAREDEYEAMAYEERLSGNESPYTAHLPPLPDSCLTDKLHHILNESAKGLSVTREMAFAALLALGSACIGQARGVLYFKETDWIEYANLYVMLIAETGNGKSPTIRYMFRHLREIEGFYKKSWKKTRAAYEKAVKAWDRDSKEPHPVPPINVQFILDDITMEAAVERLEENPRGLFWDIDEMSGWFSTLDRYNKNGGGESKKKLISAWDSRQIGYARRTNQGIANEIYITKGTMGLLGAIQPELVSGLFKEDDVKQGLPQRFLYIRTRNLKPHSYPPPQMDPNISPMIAAITENLVFGLKMESSLSEKMKGKIIGFSESAKKALDMHLSALEKSEYGGDFYTYAIKMCRMLMRLALVLHYLEWASSFICAYKVFGVDGEDAVRAIVGNEDAKDEKVEKEKEKLRDDPSLPGNAWRALKEIGIPEGKESVFKWDFRDVPPPEGEISVGTMDRAISIMNWLRKQTYWVYQILPKSMGGRGKRDPGTLSTQVARVVVDRKAEIMASDHFIRKEVLDEWLAQAGIPSGVAGLRKAFRELGMERKHRRDGWGRYISPETMRKCVMILENGEKENDI